MDGGLLFFSGSAQHRTARSRERFGTRRGPCARRVERQRDARVSAPQAARYGTWCPKRSEGDGITTAGVRPCSKEMECQAPVLLSQSLDPQLGGICPKDHAEKRPYTTTWARTFGSRDHGMIMPSRGFPTGHRVWHFGGLDLCTLWSFLRDSI